MFDTPTCSRCGYSTGADSSCGPAPARAARHEVAAPFPMPVPLLMQLTRPLQTAEDVDSLAAQLNSARARGCF